MSLESDLQQALASVIPRVFPTVAPYETAMPYAVWQRIGGDPVQFFDGRLADRRHAEVQVEVWAATTKEASEVLAEMVSALLAAPALTVTVRSEPLDSFDDADERRGVLQSLSIWGDRS